MVELWLPKNEHKGRDANNSLKWVVCQKWGQVTNGGVMGNVYCRMEKFVLQKSE